jgi:hypothetical protein
MEKPYSEMTIEELLEAISNHPETRGNVFEMDKLKAFLSARLSEQTGRNLTTLVNRLEGLGGGLLQVNKGIHKAIESGEQLAKEAHKQSIEAHQESKRMGRLTRWLVLVAAIQAIIAGISTYQAQRLTRVSQDQLEQSRLDAALVHRPYVQIRPVWFKSTNIRDPKDPGSVGYRLMLEIGNKSELPAAEVRLADYRIGSPSRGFMTPVTYPIDFEHITIFPKDTLALLMGFVMSPENTVRLYDEGREELEIFLRLTYQTPLEIGPRQNHWYECEWGYQRGTFSIKRSTSDFAGAPPP